ncbi:MAG: hypothetical protein JZD41_06735 [Thermoproteus sp.]|nr:hypothetical protein [Thermoproteus sp.]
MFDVGKLKLGVEEWKKVENDLVRIASADQLELLLNLTLVAAEEEGEDEHAHSHGERGLLPSDQEFAKEVGDLIDYAVKTYKADAHPHFHGDHGTVLFTIRGRPKDLLKAFRDLLEFARTNCEKCAVHGVDGEFHLGDDLAGIYFGDVYKITFILPAEDGRRLRVYEVHP